MAEGVIASSANRVVVGLGATGVSCARYLYERGLPFSVVDTRADPPGLEELRREMPGVRIYAGDYPPELIDSAGELIVSPGVAMDDPIVERARTSAVDVVGDIDLFVREAQAPVVGITGSNAKSTVTELLGEMARDAGLNVGVGGNIGTPALDLLDDERQLYVLELSSFQLERAGRLGLAVAAVLNLSAYHLDRHGTMQVYHQVKHRIFRGCSSVVINRDDPLTIPLVAADVALVSWRMSEPELGGFGLREHGGAQWLCHDFETLLPVSELGLAGRHNVANALAALAIGFAAGLPLASMATTLRHFKGLPHRCQLLAEIAGVRYVNDSKGTNVGATAAALSGLGGDRDVILIAGGQGKGADFKQLLAPVARHCRLLVLIGEDAQKIQKALADAVPVLLEPDMEAAVAAAAANAQAGDTVLLSPACASFDMFSGYAERGAAFCSAVERMQRTAPEGSQ